MKGCHSLLRPFLIRSPVVIIVYHLICDHQGGHLFWFLEPCAVGSCKFWEGLEGEYLPEGQ
jgi:hypothetical protein